jgi:hypothetical protein
MSLVLTPSVVSHFGRAFQREGSSNEGFDVAIDLYEDSVQKAFTPTAKARSLSALDERWTKAVIRYTKTYDRILDAYLRELGPSYFRLAYLKAIPEAQDEFKKLTIAVNDISELYRRHLADSINIATNYEELIQATSPDALNRSNELLRRSNYGITLIVLLLNGTLAAPLWILLSAHDRTRQDLSELEADLGLPTGTRLSNSFKLPEGVLDLFSDERVK